MSKTSREYPKLRGNIQNFTGTSKTSHSPPQLQIYYIIHTSENRYLRSYKQTFETAPKKNCKETSQNVHRPPKLHKAPHKYRSPQLHRTLTNLHKNIQSYKEISEPIQRPPKLQTPPNLYRHIRNYKDICFLLLADRCYDKQSAVTTIQEGPRGTVVQLPGDSNLSLQHSDQISPASHADFYPLVCSPQSNAKVKNAYRNITNSRMFSQIDSQLSTSTTLHTLRQTLSMVCISHQHGVLFNDTVTCSHCTASVTNERV